MHRVHRRKTVGKFALAMNAYRQIVEHHRQLLIEHRAQLLSDARFDRFGPIHQRIHGAQQLVMSNRYRFRHARNRHRLEPLETAQLRVRRAQAVEHHRAHQCRGIEAAARRAQRAADRLPKAEPLPQLVQRINVAESSCALVLDGARRILGATQRPVEAVDQGIEVLRLELIKTAEVGHHALSHRARWCGTIRPVAGSCGRQIG